MEGSILAMIGLGLMVGLSGTGSAIGLAISGQALLGMLKKRPEAFGVGMAMASLPATQGLYGFVGYVLYSSTITGTMSTLAGAVTLGAGLAIGFACLFSAIYQGKVCASGIEGYGSGHDVVGKTLILAAFPEFYAILSLVVAILMMSIQ
jgi:V/A-type H+-transporting ATPase subunit K